MLDKTIVRRSMLVTVLFNLGMAVFQQMVMADTISADLGTDNAANWWITVGGGGGGNPFSGGNISITSTEYTGGEWLPGSSNGSFNGFWYADETFSIPAGATNVSLNFSGLTADDRAVLELNGLILGDDFKSAATPGLGVMSFPPGPPDVSYYFTGITQGQVTQGFNTGVNDLRLVVKGAFQSCRSNWSGKKPSNRR